MKNGKHELDIDKVVRDIDESLTYLRSNPLPKDLSPADRTELIEEFDQLEMQAWKCKLNLRLRLLLDKKPTATHRAALSEILPVLPDEMAPSALAELTSYTISEWERLKGEMATSL